MYNIALQILDFSPLKNLEKNMCWGSTDSLKSRTHLIPKTDL